MTGDAIQVRGLAHAYARARPALEVSEWQVATGKSGLVIGRSGSGKSTLLNLLAGLLTVQQGEVTVAGQRVDQLRGAGLDRFRAQHVGLVPQSCHLIGALTVRQNLALAVSLAGRGGDASAAIEATLMRLAVLHRQHARPGALSAGEAQRIAIARAVLTRPALLLADEPTSALDDNNAEVVIDLLAAEAATAGATLVVVTHDARLRARLPVLLELT